MKNKIAGILLILVGLNVLFIKDWQGNWTNYEFSESYLYLPVGILIIYVGYLFLRIKKQIEFSKCSKCKVSYTYSDLKDGICPTCNIKTIDMEKYFSKYPNDKL